MSDKYIRKGLKQSCWTGDSLQVTTINHGPSILNFHSFFMQIFTQCFIPQTSLINLQFSLIYYISDHTPSWGTWNFVYCTADIHKFETFHVLQQNVSYRLNALTLYNELMWLKTEGYIILIQKLALQPSRTIFNFGSHGISMNSIMEYRTESFNYNITKHDQSYHFPKALRVSICKVLYCFLMEVLH
jgi:hypothetical protein